MNNLRLPPDNPARVTDGQNKKSLEAFITNNFEAFLRGSWRILNYQVNLFISSQLEHLQFRYYKTIVKQIFCLNRLLIVTKTKLIILIFKEKNGKIDSISSLNHDR